MAGHIFSAAVNFSMEAAKFSSWGLSEESILGWIVSTVISIAFDGQIYYSVAVHRYPVLHCVIQLYVHLGTFQIRN